MSSQNQSEQEYSQDQELASNMKSVAVKPKSVVLKIKETPEEIELREKRERLLQIKAKIAEPGGNFGIGIFNTGKSYNKFTTKDYDELKKIQKKENKFRKVLGIKTNKRPINNTENGFKPEIDPRILKHGLKQKNHYYGGGQLNMVTIEGTNAVLQQKIDKAEIEKGGELDEAELELYKPTESVLEKQEGARIYGPGAVKTPGYYNAMAGRCEGQLQSIPIKECTFQPEQKIVRYATDVTGDPEKEKIIIQNSKVCKQVKQVVVPKQKKKKMQLAEWKTSKRATFDYLKDNQPNLPPKPFSGSVKEIEEAIKKKRLGQKTEDSKRKREQMEAEEDEEEDEDTEEDDQDQQEEDNEEEDEAKTDPENKVTEDDAAPEAVEEPLQVDNEGQVISLGKGTLLATHQDPLFKKALGNKYQKEGKIMTKKKVIDQSEKIFGTKKGKEKDHFLARNVSSRIVEANGNYYLGAAGQKMENEKPSKGYQVKNTIDKKDKLDKSNVGPKQFWPSDYAEPLYHFENHYEQQKQANIKKQKDILKEDLHINTLKIEHPPKQIEQEKAKSRYQNANADLGFKLNQKTNAFFENKTKNLQKMLDKGKNQDLNINQNQKAKPAKVEKQAISGINYNPF